ncbi:MAG: hypothetical protein J6P98_05745 [Clostridia bacterium]|nr:hypothetical protein [Clostridia bacterium]
MNIRQIVTAAVLPPLRRVFPGAGSADLLFFGPAADIASPLPGKTGLDFTEEKVYNILTNVSAGWSPLFTRVGVSGGFLEFTLSDPAVEYLASALLAERGAPPFPAGFELGPEPACAVAGLLTAAACAKDAGFTVPKEPEIRKALLLSLFADTPASVNKAVRAAQNALRSSRRGAQLSRGAALSMAAALSRFTEQE